MPAPTPKPVAGHYLPLVLFGIAEDAKGVTRRLRRRRDPQLADAAALNKGLEHVRERWLDYLDLAAPASLEARLFELAERCVGALSPLRAQLTSAAGAAGAARLAARSSNGVIGGDRAASRSPRTLRGGGSPVIPGVGDGLTG